MGSESVRLPIQFSVGPSFEDLSSLIAGTRREGEMAWIRDPQPEVSLHDSAGTCQRWAPCYGMGLVAYRRVEGAETLEDIDSDPAALPFFTFHCPISAHLVVVSLPGLREIASLTSQSCRLHR